MKSFQLAAAALLATTGMAIAQEKVQISYSGVVSVEYASDFNTNENYLYGNGDVSFRWSTASDLKFGADIGIETYRSLNGGVSDELTAYYASGVVEGRFGKFSIGIPRGVMDQYFTVPALGGSELFDLEFSCFGADLVRCLHFDFNLDNQNMYGARYDGRIGQIGFGASAFKFSDYSGNVGEIAARYDAGQWSVALGTTLFELDGSSANSTSVEVEGHAGRFSGGMAYNTVGSQWSGAESFRAFASYIVNDAVKINTQVWHFQIYDSELTLYSFDLAYKHKSGAVINAGVITGETISASNDSIFSLSLGYKF